MVGTKEIASAAPLTEATHCCISLTDLIIIIVVYLNECSVDGKSPALTSLIYCSIPAEIVVEISA